MRGRAGVWGAIAVLLCLTATACFGESPRDPTESAPATPADPLGTISIAPGEPIRLGTMLTGPPGPGAATGVDALRGVRLAIDFLDGKIDGVPGRLLDHPVELVELPEACRDGSGSADDGGATSSSLATGLAGVIGPGCPGAVTGETAAGLAERGIVMISPSVTDAVLTEPATRPATFFRTAYNDLVEGAAVGRFAAGDLEARRAGLATDEGGSAGAAVGFRSAFEEGEGIVAVSGALEGGDGADRLLRAIGLGRPDVVFLTGRRAACAEGTRASGTLPALRGVPVVNSVGCFDPSFVAANAAASQLFLAGPDLTRLLEDDFYRMEFLPAYEDQFGTEPAGPFHAQAYDATVMLLDAIDRVADEEEDGSVAIGRTALHEAVAATSGVSGLSGTITCLPTGDCAPDVAIAVYRVPEVPLEGGEAGAEPVFTTTVGLGDLVPEP